MNIGELQVNFLIKASSVVSRIQKNETQKILRSLYLLRCNQLAGTGRLPLKQFSCDSRCPHCFIEWTEDTERKVTPIKLSKRQRRRIRVNGKKKNSVNKDFLLHSNNMENVCSFCGHTTKSTIIKPSDTYNKMKEEKPCIETPMILEKQNKKETKQSNVRIHKLNVYCETKEAFSLSKQNNTLPRLIKETPKIIKNSKKKKDKFAGLCRTAVTAALKLKQDKDKQNKLNLFLKPSTSTV